MSNQTEFDNIVKAQTETATIEEVEQTLNVRFKSGKMAGIIKNKLTSTVKASDLHIDRTYQRDINDNKVKLIIKNFNQNAIGVVTLSMRENGDLYIIDGSHRVEALKRMGFGNLDLNAIVFFDLSIQDESELFLLMNENRTKPKRADLHKAAVVADSNFAKQIDDVLASIGLHIGSKPGDSTVRAISTVYKVSEKIGLDNFKKVMTILVDANGTHSKFLTSEYITAVAMILANFKNVDLTRLTVAIATAGDPVLVIANAANRATNKSPFAKIVSLASIFLDGYNHRLKSNRLDKMKIMALDARNYLNA